jgi:ribosomal-protein-alanine N-acetyltransferase
MKHFPSLLSKKESDEYVNAFNRHYRDFGFTFYAIDLLEENRFIGMLGLKRINFEAYFTPGIEIGWRIHKKYWNQGLATEGAKRCIEFAFHKLDLQKIFSFATHTNLPSLRVMQKIGMQKTGEFLHPKIEKTSPLQPMILYQIEKNE